MHTTSILLTTFLSLTSAMPTGAASNATYDSKPYPPSGPSCPSTDPRPGPVSSTANNKPLIDKLQLASTAQERIGLIPNNRDFVYDFLNPPEGATTTGQGGRTVLADREVFPALIGTGVSMTVGFIGPCGFNTPHTHPRSSEYNLIVQGRLGTEFMTENGARNIINTLETFQSTVFPQGAIHTEFNPDCTPAVFAAGFASEDPGVLQSAQALFGLQEPLVRAVLGNPEVIDGVDLEKFRDRLPANVALGVESCLKKCGLKKNPAPSGPY